MLIDPNSKFTTDSGQEKEFINQIDQIRQHLHQLTLSIIDATNHLHLSKTHVSHAREGLNKLINGGSHEKSN